MPQTATTMPETMALGPPPPPTGKAHGPGGGDPPPPLVLARPEPPARALGVFSKRKGVHYCADGRVLSCRFCDILRRRGEPFLYEDEAVVVFRPLRPIAPSHILIVPRAHLRNVKMLTTAHLALLRRMRRVAARVLAALAPLQDGDHATTDSGSSSVRVDDLTDGRSLPTISTSDDDDDDDDVGDGDGDVGDGLGDDHRDEDKMDAGTHDVVRDCRFAFHLPPFNSIDHVHMHAFRGTTGYYGRIKYRTESLWCRSYDEVIHRLLLLQRQEARSPAPQDLDADHVPCQGHPR